MFSPDFGEEPTVPGAGQGKSRFESTTLRHRDGIPSWQSCCNEVDSLRGYYKYLNAPNKKHLTTCNISHGGECSWRVIAGSLRSWAAFVRALNCFF
jgi:hypothetical protein